MGHLHRLWPLPALLTWVGAWVVYLGGAAAGLPGWLALAAGAVAGTVAAAFAPTRWRGVFMAAGFPLSLAASGAPAGLPAWGWLAPLALLALLYPLRTWRDAPLFPTPAGALAGLAAVAPVQPGGTVADAGCGLGDGLRELLREYPQARVEGWEWSRPLCVACAVRCRGAQVSRRDIWATDWSAPDLVYLFQRPESMPRAAAKAITEMRPGTWLVSLEFAVPQWTPAARLEPVTGKPVWVYRAPFR